MKSFSSTINIDGTEYGICINGTYKAPLFRVFDINLILKIENINIIINDFDETQKKNIVFNNENENEEFLTVKGMNRLLYEVDKSPIILTIQEWLCDTIKILFLDEINHIKTEIHENIDTFIDDVYDRNEKYYYEDMSYIIDGLNFIKEKEAFKQEQRERTHSI